MSGNVPFSTSTAAFAFAVVLATAPAAAQDAQEVTTTGPYAVARAGAVVDTDLRFRRADAAPLTSFPREVDSKAGFTGEIGGGYDLGALRLEGTVGYSSAKLDRKKLSTGGFAADGRTRALNLGIAGYFDIPTGSVIVPYVGAGIGASRLDARLSRLTGAPVAGSSYAGKDWGLRLHADAGIGIAASPSTTIEIGARYTRVSKLEFDGQTASAGATPAADRFRPRLSSISAMLGVRHTF